MYQRIAIDLGGRGQQVGRPLALGQFEGVVCAVGADTEGLKWQFEVVDRAGWTGEIEHPVELAWTIERLD
jgi:hypothetical protein